ncbi:MAG: hypothetical protein GC185_08145 [Alphaproteobacteria bacterium]|nr:hypothetical protein [Alphaproteobacteria bacterium]
MSWSRTAAVLCLALALAGCGFTPMYGDKSAGGGDSSAAQGALAVSRSTVEVANIPDRNGQYLRNQLIDRLYLKGRPADAPYLLSITPLKDTTTDLGIRTDATATRAMYEIDASMTLTNKASGKVILQRNVRSVGGYNELDNQFATLVSAQNLRDNMLHELADTVVRQLDLYFNRAPKGDVSDIDTVTPARRPSVLLPADMQGPRRPAMLPPVQEDNKQSDGTQDDGAQDGGTP